MMEGMYIKRHTPAARGTLHLIMDGSYGNRSMFADVGSEAKHGRLGALGVCQPDYLTVLAWTQGQTQLEPDIMFTNTFFAELKAAGAPKNLLYHLMYTFGKKQQVRS